jgi:hypothetical protein
LVRAAIIAGVMVGVVVRIMFGVVVERIMDGVTKDRVMWKERPWPWAAGTANASSIGPAKASRPQSVVDPTIKRDIRDLLGDERTDRA